MQSVNALKETLKSLNMSSEPECKCPLAHNGSIDHTKDCAWKIWKTTGIRSTEINHKFDASKIPERIFEGQKRRLLDQSTKIHDLSVRCLIVKDNLRMAAPTSQVLIDSIRLNGIRKPIIVSDLGNGYWQIIDGVERFKAVILLGMHNIPGYVK